MIILAGIDEAGLGPTLGPLATACAAFSAPASWGAATPWEALADACCARSGRGETRIGVADSKVLYRQGGMAALEMTVGVFACLTGGGACPALEGKVSGRRRTHPCYSGRLDPFPRHAAPEALACHTEAVAENLRRAGASVVHLEGALAYEPDLNRRFDSGLNKNQVLLIETGRHVRRLADKFADRPLRVVVDKQGGRNDYLPFLVSLFPGKWPRVIEAGAERSVYRYSRPGGPLEIVFQAKADRDSFPTALASLLAKYARERAMEELNAWFCARVPGLEETAGYPTDARRWLSAVKDGTGELMVELVVRKR